MLSRTSLLAALALLTTLLPAGSASAAVQDVPDGATVRIVGHGYGHGHGLSQYGAQNAATKGVGYRKILRYYYPGTRPGKAGGPVRVLISADTSRDVVVAARRGLVVRSVGGRPTRLDAVRPRATRWRIVPVAGGRRSAVDFKMRSSWRRLKTLKGDAEFVAGGRPIRLFMGGGSRSYRGALRSAAPGQGLDRDTVNVVSLDAYLKGVVPREVPSYWHPQALRAQAVAARTYAAYERKHSTRRHYQLCDTDRCQVYGGATDEQQATSKAIDATRGQVLTHGGGPIFSQFSASSGGWTARGAFSYLPAKPDQYDDFRGNDYHDWTVSTTDAKIEQTWPAVGDLASIDATDRDGNGEWGGRVGTVVLRGSGGTVTVSGDDFRYLLGLYSTWFTVRVS
ncbi:SpoIID/LytB domain-containing protein [Nocardioides sp. cx-173]|uniref:SpoIID/LytB domain-containing protein n=1 Tax=Nocardioides sp. cx-173 TaxID=2898796 RepID=UPI001E5F769A|nr:SpoIID/LytB domain-containing protein [Nocardioides sp. cx-173]MCD4526982.1 SpoIID/LytB domain-containing protein [Nocardioides sp. cx-173]UGB41083.1 SpoIID/LytB domain-containing protein [Nocardioides sp. cx-173]